MCEEYALNYINLLFCWCGSDCDVCMSRGRVCALNRLQLVDVVGVSLQCCRVLLLLLGLVNVGVRVAFVLPFMFGGRKELCGLRKLNMLLRFRLYLCMGAV
jgi:hypothetical protein